jgi:hypothetical protein
MQKENEICAKSESIDNIILNITTYESKIEELERQIQIFMSEKKDLEIKVEEAVQDSGSTSSTSAAYLILPPSQNSCHFSHLQFSQNTCHSHFPMHLSLTNTPFSLSHFLCTHLFHLSSIHVPMAKMPTVLGWREWEIALRAECNIHFFLFPLFR